MRKFKVKLRRPFGIPKDCFRRTSLSGFTLIEVMVALVILSLVAGSLSMSVSQATKNIGQSKQHQFAAWVAHNQLSLYMLKALNRNSEKKNFGGFKFTWNITKAPTDTENFNKITVAVANVKTPDYLLANIIAFKDES